MRHEEIDDMRFEVDIKKSLIVGVPFFLFMILIFLFLFLTVNLIAQIEDQSIELIALIVFMFSMVKLFRWIGYPTIYFKEKIKLNSVNKYGGKNKKWKNKKI